MAIQTLLKLMTQSGASDLFVTPGIPPRVKVNGQMRNLQQNALNVDQVTKLVHGIMTANQLEEFQSTYECNFGISATGIGRFRVSAFVQRDTPGMVIRRIETHIPTFKELHLPDLLEDLAMSERGLLAFVGSTGTGKSTSIAAAIGHRNANTEGHIICVEDPVEFIHNHDRCIVTQREVGIDTVSYLIALRNALRQSPDVLVVGEVRMQETMQHALSFAETGHLAITSLHAANAYQALERMVNFFPKDQRQQVLFDLSMNLRGIVAQQLVPTADGEGQRVVTEILINTPLVADLIRRGELDKLHDVIKRSGELGMNTFDRSLYDLYEQGVITAEDAIRHATSENEVRLMIKLGGAQAGTERQAPGRVY